MNSKNKRKDAKADFTEKLKIVAEFQGVKEHKDFVASMTKERDLKSRIKASFPLLLVLSLRG